MNNTQKIIKVIAIAFAIFLIINIFSIIFSGLSWLIDINSNNTDNKTTFKEVYQDVREIEIEGVSSSIEITSGTEFKVETKNLDNGFSSNIRNGVLKLVEQNKWFSKMKSKGFIYITIPKDSILNELSIDAGSGKIKIKDISVKEFDIDHGAGILEIQNVKFNSSDIDGGAGKIKIKDSNLNNLELDAGVGEIEIIASITGNSQINCGVGKVDIILIGNEEDYRIITEKGIGNIKINGTTQKNSTVYGNGDEKLEIEGGIGNIEVSFQ